jgi:glycine hydroxymethyltransferase
MLVNLTSKGITGKEAEESLDKAGITVNKNVIPYEERPASISSGMRLGTPCVTTRGMGEEEMTEIADIITSVIENNKDTDAIASLSGRVDFLCDKFPLYNEEHKTII